MDQKEYLLNDQQMKDFIRNGYITVQTHLPAEFHESVFQQTENVFETEGNPGNNLLPRIPMIQEVFDDKRVNGALTSVLGKDYYLQPHRHCHFNPPNSNGQNLHQDGGKRWSHYTRWLLALYYPQETPEDLGPTGIIPKSHYYGNRDSIDADNEVPLCGKAGTVTITNYDLWHRAMPNNSSQKRYMMKFLFARMSEPEIPSWNNQDLEWEPSETKQLDANNDAKMFQQVWKWHCGQTNNNSHYHSSSVTKLQELIRKLRQNSEPKCIDIAYAISEFGTKAVPTLITQLEDESEDIRRYAFCALSAIGQPAVSSLITAVQHSDWWVRASAVETLGNIGNSAQAAIPSLKQALQDESEQVRQLAAEALGTTSQNDSTAVSSLVLSLGDENDKVRRNSVLALARLGRYAHQAVDNLQMLLSDDDRYVRGDAVHALRRIDTPEAREVLIQFLIKSRWCQLTSKENGY